MNSPCIGCPIYHLVVKPGYEKLMPAMCNCDFPGIDFLQAGLVGPRTGSNGDDRCDSWIVSANSDSDIRRKPGKRPAGQSGLGIKTNDTVKLEAEG